MRGAIITLIVVIALAVIGAVLWATGVFGGGSAGSVGFGGNAENYQAVFLSNGQDYFGKFNQSAGVVKLSDIYYLQVQQQLQPKEGETGQQPELKLIKLGNELHGPTDEMRVNPDHILFIEDLKDDGKVVEAIVRYEREGPDEAGNLNSDVAPAESSSSADTKAATEADTSADTTEKAAE